MAFTIHDEKHLELVVFLQKLRLLPGFGQFIHTKNGIYRVTFKTGTIEMWNIFD